MFSLIEALNYRCLRYVRQPLGPFHVLVGPNASGKTTFLDVLGFLHGLVAGGLDEAVDRRSNNFADLVWRHEGGQFELAVEAQIPEPQRVLLDESKYDTVRYEVAVCLNTETQEVQFAAEQAFLTVAKDEERPQKDLFPMPDLGPSTIITKSTKRGTRRLFSKTPGGNDNYYSEARPKQGRWQPVFKLGPRKSTLANLPEDETNFPVSTWLKNVLENGVESVVLNSLQMRRPSPPGKGTGLRPDGSNLPWAVAELESRRPERFREWVEHLRTALPDLQGIRTVLREEDKNRYLKLDYDCGVELPSWVVSDGTLRLIALTLVAYADQPKSVYLIDEPENGIHPLAIETMYQSLGSVYDAQVVMATHSPVILAIADPCDVLCFAKTPEGATDVVRGSEHPRLRDWHGEVDLGTLFASGVLG